MDTLLKSGLGKKSWVVLVVRLALCLPHVVSEGGARAGLEEGDHGLAEEAVRVAHVEELSVLALGEDAEVNCRNILIPCVDNRGSILHELEGGELLKSLLAKLVLDLFFGPLALFLDIETAEIYVILCLPPSKSGKTRNNLLVCHLIKWTCKQTYPTLVVGGGGRPRTPETLTRFSPTCSNLICSS
jgi:hypothetical protein